MTPTDLMTMEHHKADKPLVAPSARRSDSPASAAALAATRRAVAYIEERVKDYPEGPVTLEELAASPRAHALFDVLREGAHQDRT